MWSFWLEWEQSSYLLNHQGKKEPKSRSLIRTSTSILKGSQEAELTCEAAGEATRSSVSGKPELDGEGGILFPALSIPDENPSLILLWPMCTLTGIARRGAIATWRRRRRRRNEQSWMKNIQERVFPLVRHLKGFVFADGVKIANHGGGELRLGGWWCWCW